MNARLARALADRYTIERELGEGGMATVYLARDVKHEREVAIKVLKPDLAAVLGAERFIQEIRTTAQLQHPHILPLFDSGQADGFLYYVMPYVEGETLRNKLDREHQLGIDEAVKITTEVADALDYAHRHGVIHRDIKPENILLHDGRPVVADFGIALAVSAAAGGRMTETGLSLGTPHYMSPEQATAEKDITARSDVYSLASVLYEMLAGQPPHIGGSAQQIILKVLTDDVTPVAQLRRAVPPNVAAAVAQALEKLPADRFDSARAFSQALTNTTYHAAVAAMAGRHHVFPWWWRGTIVTLAVVAVLAAIFGVVEWRAAHDVAPHNVVRFHIDLPPSILFANTAAASNVAISPDGLVIAYTVASDQGTTGLYIRRLDEATAHLLPGTDGAQQPCFSPDGRWIAYLVGANIWKVPAEGGTPVSVGSIRLGSVGLAWSGTGLILAGTSAGLIGVPVTGGPARVIAATDPAAGDLYFDKPWVLPDGGAVLLSALGSGGAARERLVKVSLATGKVTRIPFNVYDPLGLVDGILVYIQSSGALMAVPIDVDHGRVRGNPVNLGITVSTTTSGATQAAMSPTGTLLYQSLASSATLGWVDGPGTFRPVWNTPQIYAYPRLSPDGRRIAMSIGTAGASDIWIYDIASGTPTRLTNTSAGDERPEWSPGGRRVLYRNNEGLRSALWWVPADLSGPATPLQASDAHNFFEGVITPDGRDLVYQMDDGGVTQADVMYRALSGDTASRPIAATQANEAQARVSPDGKWVAFVTDASGAAQVVVRPFPGPGGQVQVSVAGGAEPVWSRDGRRLFYRDGHHMIAATIATVPQFAVKGRTELFPDEYLFAQAPHADYDVSPEGTRFLMMKSAEPPKLIVVYGWFNALRRQLSATGK